MSVLRVVVVFGWKLSLGWVSVQYQTWCIVISGRDTDKTLFVCSVPL